jgi:hypothetical protein
MPVVGHCRKPARISLFAFSRVFATFSVELDDQILHLSREVNKGFAGLKKITGREDLKFEEAQCSAVA